MPSGLRIALIVPSKDPLGPNQWSGTPFGLARGFEALGHETVAVGHLLPPGLRHAEAALARAGGQRGPVADRAPSRVAARRHIFAHQLRRAGRVDLVVAMITDAYRLQDLDVTCPVVTYDDGTFQQMWEHPDSDLANSGFPERAVARWIRTQRDSMQAATVCCVSTGWAKRSVVEDYGVPSDRVQVVGMGHRPRASADGARDWSHPAYLFVGVDWRRKNGQRVLDAFARIHAEDPAARLHLVGRHDPVEAPGVVDHGLLKQRDAAEQATLDRLFAECTAFVLPSLLDPSPIAYLEAASAGLPVVATSQGGAGELLRDAAITVDPHDGEAIHDAMRRLADPATARRMGASARTASLDSTWTAVAGRVLAAAGLRPVADEGVRR